MTGATSLQLAIAKARSCWLGHHAESFIYSSEEQFVPPQSVAVAYRRSVFDTVGMFDENFDACEDVEFNHRVDRAGLRCFFTPKVAVRYYPRSSLRYLFCQLARYGRGRARLLRKHPRTLGPATVIPALFVLWLITLPLMAISFPILWIGWFLGIAVYAMTLLVTSATIAFSSEPALCCWLPIVFATVHTGAGVGFLFEVASWLFPSRSGQSNAQ